LRFLSSLLTSLYPGTDRLALLLCSLSWMRLIVVSSIPPAK
jgi:hypothetical protein